MNIFASGRIKPSNVNFPKGFNKLDWTHVTNCKDFMLHLINNKTGHVVIDSFGFDDGDALKAAYIMTEVVIEKHTSLPTILVIGPNQDMKDKIQTHLSNSKRWIDISRGK